MQCSMSFHLLVARALTQSFYQDRTQHQLIPHCDVGLCRYFGLHNLADRTVQAILAFMPSVPNWAYNGAALGIGDFSNNAKLTPYGGWERPLQHYRAGALPILLS